MTRLTLALLALALGATVAIADNWPRFRGADGLGKAPDATVPTTWDGTKNILWKTELPGPGSSSPIVWGDRVFVTSYSGYGESERNPGEMTNLKRHLVCASLKDGTILWSKSVAAEQPEDPYRGFITEHGYASNTPVTDGETVFAFFGKTGVLAYDMDGNELWKVNVGKESSGRRWGTAASPILYKDMVIVNASEESQSIRALDKKTGKEIWKSEAASLELVYATPTLVELPDGAAELVIAVPGEVWALAPDTGKLKWFAEVPIRGNVSPTVINNDGVVYAFGGLPAGSVAVKAGGTGDVTNSNVLWRGRSGSYVATPVLHDGHLYWIDDRGTAHCAKADTGESVYSERMPNLSGGGRPFYASPVLVGKHLYIVSRSNGTFVLKAEPTFEIVARNVIEGDDSQANGTPAVVENTLVLRTDRALYRIGESDQK